jgi:hypothetical protein
MCGCGGARQGAGQPWQVIDEAGQVVSTHATSASARIAASRQPGATIRQQAAK